MSTAAATPINDVAKNDYKVADISLADFGRREITLAEAEMPALMTLRKKYAAERPLAGAKIIVKRHDLEHFQRDPAVPVDDRFGKARGAR